MTEGTVRVVVSGASGRMGAALAAAAGSGDGVRLVGGIAPAAAGAGEGAYPVLEVPAAAASLIEGSDVLIDFSAPDFLREILEAHGETLAGRALVVGTTGLGEEDDARLAQLAERSAVLVAANFSVGVAVLTVLVEQAARALGPEFDMEIVESHHRRKEDAPSGTALALGRAAATGRGLSLDQVRRDGRSGRPGARPGGEIGFHALRGGSVVGEHEVLFLGDGERVELNHRAGDRAIFATGAMRAARWVAGRAPGRYTMRDVLGLT